MILDVLIAALVLLAAFVGFQRGLIQPLLVELCFFLVLFVFLHDRNGYLAFMDRFLHANAVFAIFLALLLAIVAAFFGGRLGGLIHRMPVVRAADGFFGVFVQAFIAIMVCYVFLSALVAMDKAFQPAVNAASLSPVQVQAVKRALSSSSIASSFVDWQDFKRLEQLARNPGGTRISQAPQLNQLATGYEDFLRPQLSGSRLAPVVFAIGQRVPGFGKYGPRDVPKRPRATAAPSPTPKKQ